MSLRFGRLGSLGKIPMPASGGGPAPPQLTGGVNPDIYADFAHSSYLAAGASQSTFAAWLTAVGGAYSRSSSATYIDGGIVKTAASNVARIGANGIRLTGAATNIQTQSSDFSTASWTPVLVTTVPGQPDPAGGNTAVVVDPTGGASSSHGFKSTINPNFDATSWTVSLFAKNAGYNFLVLDINAAGQQHASFDLTTGATAVRGSTVTAGSMQLANGWWLCWMTATPVNLGNSPPAFIVSNTAALPPGNLSGNGTSGIMMWGAQVTNTAFQCDYIPTTTATVAQAADSFSFPWTSTTGSALVNTTGQINYNPVINPAIIIAGERWIFNGSTVFASYNGTAILNAPAFTGAIENLHKIMVAGSPTGRSITVDGAVPASDGNKLDPGSPSFMSLGSGNGYANAWYEELALWNGIVATNADMQRLTT